MNQTKTLEGSKEALKLSKPFLEKFGGDQADLFRVSSSSELHAFVKWLQKNAIYEDVAKNEKEDIAFRRCYDTAKEFGVRFSNGALEYLAGKIGAHSRLGVEEPKSSLLIWAKMEGK